MRYIKLPDIYPYSQTQLRQDNPGVSFPQGDIPLSTLAEFDVYLVASTPLPPYNEQTHRVVELLPVKIADSWVQVWDLVALTDEEQAEQFAAQAAAIRAERNRLLAACDWTQLADAPVSSFQWANYRQALRDVPSQVGFPWTVVWPTPPV